ncbi:MAG: hypothetical protein EBS68_16315, partial [Rhodobacteraceae bacterium]|nr:hypothetical protein [Paracoccaceae bacterium]
MMNSFEQTRSKKAHPRLIRSALAIGGFLALTGVLVALQPDRSPPLSEADVTTRAATDLGPIAAPQPQVAPVQVAAAVPAPVL